MAGCLCVGGREKTLTMRSCMLHSLMPPSASVLALAASSMAENFLSIRPRGASSTYHASTGCNGRKRRIVVDSSASFVHETWRRLPALARRLMPAMMSLSRRLFSTRETRRKRFRRWRGLRKASCKRYSGREATLAAGTPTVVTARTSTKVCYCRVKKGLTRADVTAMPSRLRSRRRMRHLLSKREGNSSCRKRQPKFDVEAPDYGGIAKLRLHAVDSAWP